ncbi:hypothetical protein KC887_05280 [Candidatus Kaiserbacteria bacterium]|nr:hypothetical protein [Candidatus Kaiserbacteria bacterium]
MTILSDPIAPSDYYTWQTVEDLAFSNYQQGGVENVLVATLLFSDTTKSLFTLPKGAIVTQVQVDINTAFNAGATNTIDVGLGSTVDALVDGASAASIARLFPAQDVPTLTPLAAATAVTATYNQTSTAADAGAAYIWVRYIVVEAS